MDAARERLDAIFAEHEAVAAATRRELLAGIAQLAADIDTALGSDGKLVVFGNGGSAADAQHFAAELVGHFQVERPGLPALALTANTSILTAIANDYDYDTIFERQVDALCRPADVVVGISTSGDSENVVRGVRAARAMGAGTWGMTGARGGLLADAAARVLRVPSERTARIQELHITIIHAVSALLDERPAGTWPRRS